MSEASIEALTREVHRLGRQVQVLGRVIAFILTSLIILARARLLLVA